MPCAAGLNREGTRTNGHPARTARRRPEVCALRREAVFRGARCERSRPSEQPPLRDRADGFTVDKSMRERRKAPRSLPLPVRLPPLTRQRGSAGFRRRSRPVIMPHHADYLPVLPRPPVRTPSLLQLSAVRYLTNIPCAMRWPCAMRYGSAPRLNRRMPMLPSFWVLE